MKFSTASSTAAALSLLLVSLLGNAPGDDVASSQGFVRFADATNATTTITPSNISSSSTDAVTTTTAATPTTTVATAATAIPRRCANSFNGNTIQVTGSWLEFCPCVMADGGATITASAAAAANVKNVDPIDGNDNGCVSIQVAKVTTTDDTQKVYADDPPTPFSTTISQTIINATTNDAQLPPVSGSTALPSAYGSYLPTQQSGQNYYVTPSAALSSSYPNGLPIDTIEANYGSGATLSAIMVTNGEGNLYLNSAQTAQPLKAGDRMFTIRCKEGRDILDHNIYLRVKVYGQSSSNIGNYEQFITADFFKYVMVTNTMTPPQQIPFDDHVQKKNNGTAASPFFAISNVYGSKWVRFTHKGDSAHPIQNSVAVSPTFIFGVHLADMIDLSPNASRSSTTTTTDVSTTTAMLDTNETTLGTTIPSTTPPTLVPPIITAPTYQGGAAGRRTTTPIPNKALGRSSSSSGMVMMVSSFAAVCAAAVMAVVC